MPASSSAHAHAAPSAPRRPQQAVARVRWDRLGRAAMLCVMAALIYLYLSAGIHMFSTWRQSHRDNAAVSTLEAEHRNLEGQHKQLIKPGTLEAEARRLGMMKPHEQPYVISGLPDN